MSRKKGSERLPVRLAAELTEVHAAHLAAQLRVPIAAQVAAHGAVRQEGLQEHLVQGQVVGG